jgi:hypothetical protein
MQQLPKLTKIRLSPEHMSTEKSPYHWKAEYSSCSSNMLKMRDKCGLMRPSLTLPQRSWPVIRKDHIGYAIGPRLLPVRPACAPYLPRRPIRYARWLVLFWLGGRLY